MMKPVPPTTCGDQKKTSAIATGGEVAKFGITCGRPVLRQTIEIPPMTKGNYGDDLHCRDPKNRSGPQLDEARKETKITRGS